MLKSVHLFITGLSLVSSQLMAMEAQKTNPVLLSFSDNRPGLTDLTAINTTLKTVGVHLSPLEIPARARPILNGAHRKKLDQSKISTLLEIFSLKRKDILHQVALAGRKPVIANGGSLTTGEVGVAPYPKIYDLKAMNAQDRLGAQNKFGKLHVNYADTGVGVDEVMTLVSGGAWTWYFRLKDGVVAKLSISRIEFDENGWRISYPGLTPHGAFMDAEDGICIAYIVGPETWKMKYSSPDIEGAEILGTNPWIDFSSLGI